MRLYSLFVWRSLLCSFGFTISPLRLAGDRVLTSLRTGMRQNAAGLIRLYAKLLFLIVCDIRNLVQAPSKIRKHGAPHDTRPRQGQYS